MRVWGRGQAGHTPGAGDRVQVREYKCTLYTKPVFAGAGSVGPS